MVNANGVVYPTQPWMLCKAIDHRVEGLRVTNYLLLKQGVFVVSRGC